MPSYSDGAQSNRPARSPDDTATLLGWLLGRRRQQIDLAKLATDIAAELLDEMRTEIDRLTEQLTAARGEADQLRAELAATRAELAALRNPRI